MILHRLSGTFRAMNLGLVRSTSKVNQLLIQLGQYFLLGLNVIQTFILDVPSLLVHILAKYIIYFKILELHYLGESNN